MMLSLFESNGA